MSIIALFSLLRMKSVYVLYRLFLMILFIFIYVRRPQDKKIMHVVSRYLQKYYSKSLFGSLNLTHKHSHYISYCIWLPNLNENYLASPTQHVVILSWLFADKNVLQPEMKCFEQFICNILIFIYTIPHFESEGCKNTITYNKCGFL